MLLRLALSAAWLLSAHGCSPELEGVPPPIQRSAPPGSEPPALGPSVQMASPEVDSHIVAGIPPGDPGSPRRWTGERPELRFQLAQTRGQKVFVDLVIAEVTFEQTGPVTVRFFVEGRPVGSARYDAPGPKRFEAAVPPELLKAGEPVVLAAEVDQVWVSPEDGARLGFLLVGAGFTE